MSFSFDRSFVLSFILFFVLVTRPIFSVDVTYTTNTTLTDDLRLSLSQRAIFDATLTLDGDGFFYQLPLTEDEVIVVNAGFTATLEDLLIRDLLPGHISLGAGSDLIFGDGTRVELLQSFDLGADTWKFSGVSFLDGKKRSVDLSSGGVIQVEAGGSLTLENINFTGVGASSIVCADDTATIKFKNVNLTIPTRFDFGSGAFSVQEGLSLLGGGIFSYESAYASTILDNSWLKMSDSMTFSYDPAQGAEQPYASAQNLVMTNTSSRLILDSATLKLTTTGLRLLGGALCIEGKASLFADAPDLSNFQGGFSLGDPAILSEVQVEISGDACLEVVEGDLYYGGEVGIRTGDSIRLRNYNFGFYLMTSNETYSDQSPAINQRVVGGSFVANDESRWYVNLNDTLASSTSTVNRPLLSGQGPRLSFENKAHPGGSIISFAQDLSEAVAPVSTPTPPYYRLRYNVPPQASGFRMFKVFGSSGDRISPGDVVIIRNEIQSIRDGVFYASGLDFTDNALNVLKEVVQYDGLAPDIAGFSVGAKDTNHYWIVEDVIQDDYLNYP